MNADLPEGILFDLDDTILEREKPHVVWEKVLTRYAPMIDGAKPEDIMRTILEKREWYWSHPERNRIGRLNPTRAIRQIINDSLTALGIRDPRIVDEMVEVIRIQMEGSEKPYPGAVDALRSLHTQGVRLALVTNGSRESQRTKLEKHELSELFDSILIEGEIGFGKPDPRVYNHALDSIKVKAKDAWMVGDNLEWEVAAPQRLGIFGVWVDESGEGMPENSNVTPDKIVRCITELA